MFSSNPTEYSHYTETETLLNKQKFQRTSLTADEVRTISSYYKTHRSSALKREDFFAVCHGVRNGSEIRAFKKNLSRRVIGTDISSTILGVPDGFLCDFSECPPLWQGKVDFLYSNALDHARDINYTLTVWKHLLSPEGLMFIQITDDNEMDMKISFDELLKRIADLGCHIVEVVELQPTRHRALPFNLLFNGLRRLCNMLARTILPKSCNWYWRFSYYLKRGVSKRVRVIVVSGNHKQNAV